MIQNIEKGRGFVGLAKYLLGKEDAVRLGGTLQGETIKQLSSEARAVRRLNKNAAKSIVHTSLSLPPGERLSDEQWLEIAEKYVERMGYGECAWMAVRHHDTEHDHIHIGIIRIDLTTGKSVSDSWDYKRGEAIVRELEKEYGLQPVQERAVSRKMNRNEINKTLRTGEVSHRQRIAEAIDAALETPCSLPEFIERLTTVGVGVKLNMSVNTGFISGISFDLDGHIFKGSKIGKSYSWANLKKRGITYDKNRDREAVIAQQNRTDEKRNLERNSSAGSSTTGSDSDRGRLEDNKYRNTRDAENNASSAEILAGTTKVNAEIVKRDEKAAEASSDAIRHIHNANDKWCNTASVTAITASAVSKSSDTDVQRTASLKAKTTVWRKQHSALRAPYYRLTLTSRRDHLKTFNLGKNKAEDGEEKFYTAKEIEDLIPFLSAKNRDGYDIYITPISNDFHYIVLDDSTPEKIKKAEQKYGNVCLIQESSRGNQQAIFKVEKKHEFKNEQKLANKLVQQMNKEFGDPAFSGVIHPFRMAGFSNKKQGKNNYFTRIIRLNNTIADKLNKMLEDLRDKYNQVLKYEIKQQVKQLKERKIKQQVRQNIKQNTEIKIEGNDEWSKAKRLQLAFAKSQVIRGRWMSIDMSAVEYRTVKELLKQGLSAEDIIEQMYDDTDIPRRHSNIDDYIERTVSRAEEEFKQEQKSKRSRQFIDDI